MVEEKRKTKGVSMAPGTAPPPSPMTTMKTIMSKEEEKLQHGGISNKNDKQQQQQQGKGGTVEVNRTNNGLATTRNQEAGSEELYPPIRNDDFEEEQQQQPSQQAADGHDLDPEEPVLDSYLVVEDKKQVTTKDNDDAVDAVVLEDPSKKDSRIFILAILFLVVVAAISIGTALGIKQRKRRQQEPKDTLSSSSPSSSIPSVSVAPSWLPTMPPQFPTMTPSEIPTSISYSLVVDEIRQEFADNELILKALEDSTSSTSRAAAWLAKEAYFEYPLALIPTNSSTTTTTTKERIHFRQRFALASLFFATGGTEEEEEESPEENDNSNNNQHPWMDRCNFLSPIHHVCQWKCTLPDDIAQDRTGYFILGFVDFLGVLCAEDIPIDIDPELYGRIISLDLVRNGLEGTIPPEIQGLDYLEIFNVISNNIGGTVPFEDLSRDLVRFVASSNQFTGTIPFEAIWEYSVLRELELSRNQLTGTIPHQVGLMMSLEYLNLGENQLSGTIPGALFSQLPFLSILDLGDNLLTGSIVGTEDDTPNSTTAIVNAPRLEVLELQSNSLNGTIPETFFDHMDSLFFLNLGFNELSGTIPTGIAKLGQREEQSSSSPLFQLIDLRWNQFTGRFFEDDSPLWNLSDLVAVLLIGNQFLGTLSSSIGSTTSLANVVTNFNVGTNQLTGTIPTEIGNVLNLQILGLAQNQFVGQIPTEMARLTALATLTMQQNELTGSLEGLCNRKPSSSLGIGIGLQADCNGEVECGCCTECCDPVGNCGPPL